MKDVTQDFIVRTWGNDAMGSLLRWIINPATHVRARVAAMKAEARGATLIGLQMRRRYGTAADRCPYTIPTPHGPGRVPTYSHYSDEHEILLLDCAAALARRYRYGDEDEENEEGGAGEDQSAEEAEEEEAAAARRRVMFYVSSDTPEEVTELVAERLGNSAILRKGAAYYGTAEASVASMGRSLAKEMLAGGVGEYEGQGEEGQAGLRAALDVLMLAECDQLVITPSSTYGLMAAALARPRPGQGPMFPSRWGQCVRAVADGVQWSHSWLRVRRTTCFADAAAAATTTNFKRSGDGAGSGSGMLRPEMDMFCPDCTLWACPCDGANPCAAHSDKDNALHAPRFSAHLPL